MFITNFLLYFITWALTRARDLGIEMFSGCYSNVSYCLSILRAAYLFVFFLAFFVSFQ